MAKKRVVIVGAGFGGMAAVKGLKHADADVTLIDRTNHHLFQPLLYQADSGAVAGRYRDGEPGAVAPAEERHRRHGRGDGRRR